MRRFDMLWIAAIAFLLVIPGAVMIMLGALKGRTEIWLGGLTMLVMGLNQLSHHQIKRIERRLASLEEPSRR